VKEQQLLRDPGAVPTSKIIAECLGLAYNAYVKFIEELTNHDIQVDWRYYADGRAWLGKALHKRITARGTQKEVTVFWLSVWSGFFKVSFYIPEKARATALNLSLGDKVRSMMENSKQIGKLRFFPLVFDLDSDELFGEIYTIADFRKMLK